MFVGKETKGLSTCVLFLLLLLAVACAPRSPDNNDLISLESNPDSNLTYSVTKTDIKLQFAGVPYEIPVENCGNPRDSIQTITRSHSFITSLDIEVSNQVAAEFGGDIKVAEVALREQIGAALGVRIGIQIDQSFALEITTPPNTQAITTVQWKEQWTTGDVSIIRPNGSSVDVLPFAALNSVILEQQGVRIIECGHDGEVLAEDTLPEVVPTIIVPTVIPTIAATPTPMVLGTISVPGNSNEGYVFHAPAPGSYIFKYVSGAYSTYPVPSIPPGLATWLADVRAFKNRPVEWNGDDISERPDLRVINLGYGFTADEAEGSAREHSVPVTISLAQGDTLILVGVDKKDAYNDNPGGVVLEVLFMPLP